MNKLGLIKMICCLGLLGCQTTYENLSTKQLTSALGEQKVAFNVNQVGYYSDWSKVAYVTGVEASQPALLVNFDSGEVVEQLQTRSVESQNPDLPLTSKIDFSHIQKAGRYVLTYQNVRSPIFSIDDQIYQDAVVKLLRSYTLQRCGEPLNDVVADLKHEVCHLDDSQLFRPLVGVTFEDNDNHTLQASQGWSISTPAPIEIDTTGGWHDAGDFGKYTTTTAVSIGRVLSSYLSQTQYLGQLDLSLEDHVATMPDVLTEMKFGLTWLLKMQHDTGVVYRKVGGKRWPSLGAPEKDTQQRYVYGVATDDTAKFAATMALAARVYEPFDQELASTYLLAANRAWHYLASNPEFMLDWQKHDDSGSGPYKANSTDKELSLTYDTDDRFWAAAELYLTTKKSEFLVYINQHIELPLNLYEWKDPAALGKWHLYQTLCNDNAQRFCQILQQQFITRADAALARSLDSDYALANDKFIWGSNKMVAEEGLFLLQAYQLTGEEKYAMAAIHQADYLMGANPFSLSFVSDVGEKPVKNVSHIYARGEKEYIPGLFVGGPNQLAQANVAPKNKGILSYVDDAKSYAVNEYAIDYNASLIGLLVELRTLNIKE